MNVERFGATLEYIEKNQGEWNQVKPNACFLAIAQFLFGGERRANWPRALQYRDEPPFTLTNALELTHEEYTWCFDERRTLDDYRRVLVDGFPFNRGTQPQGDVS